LDHQSNLDFLSKIRTGIDSVLEDSRFDSPPDRQMLEQSKSVITEMLDQKTCLKVEKLVELAKWMKARSEEQTVIQEAGGPQTPKQQFVMENPLAEGAEDFACLIDEMVSACILIDGAAAGEAKLEAAFQLYLHFREVLGAGGSGIPDFLALKASEWLKNRFLQLSAEQKRQVLTDMNHSRESRTLQPPPDSSPGEPPTPQELAAYQAAYQFILRNAPPP
jgi:hypothetical protein